MGYLDHKKFVVKKVKKATCLKWTYGHAGNDYRVATLSKSYLTTTGITMQILKSMGQFLMKKLSVLDVRTYPNYRKASLSIKIKRAHLITLIRNWIRYILLQKMIQTIIYTIQIQENSSS